MMPLAGNVLNKARIPTELVRPEEDYDIYT